jgi:hypothetical protein
MVIFQMIPPKKEFFMKNEINLLWLIALVAAIGFSMTGCGGGGGDDTGSINGVWVSGSDELTITGNSFQLKVGNTLAWKGNYIAIDRSISQSISFVTTDVHGDLLRERDLADASITSKWYSRDQLEGGSESLLDRLFPTFEGEFDGKTLTVITDDERTDFTKKGGGGAGGGAGGGGKFTLTGIPAKYNGCYIMITSADVGGSKPNLVGMASLTTYAKISNGSVSVTMYEGDLSKLTVKGYTGNDTYFSISITIWNGVPSSSSSNLLGSFATMEPVTFRNGSASLSWDDVDGLEL